MIWLVTPLFGSLRNYSKYKQFNPWIFIRTPVLYFLIFLYLQTRNVWKVLMIERWIMLAYKTLLSIISNDYIIKKEKYKRKYGLKYS